MTKLAALTGVWFFSDLRLFLWNWLLHQSRADCSFEVLPDSDLMLCLYTSQTHQMQSKMFHFDQCHRCSVQPVEDWHPSTWVVCKYKLGKCNNCCMHICQSVLYKRLTHRFVVQSLTCSMKPAIAFGPSFLKHGSKLKKCNARFHSLKTDKDILSDYLEEHHSLAMFWIANEWHFLVSSHQFVKL